MQASMFNLRVALERREDVLLPAMYQLGERMWRVTEARGVKMFVKIITNGRASDRRARPALRGAHGAAWTRLSGQPGHPAKRPCTDECAAMLIPARIDGL